MARKRRSAVSNLGDHAKKRNTSLSSAAKNPQCETPSPEIVSTNVRNCNRNYSSVARELRSLLDDVPGVDRQITSGTNLRMYWTQDYSCEESEGQYGGKLVL